MNVKQITKNLSKQLLEWDFEKAIANSNKEANTIDNLVKPFLNILGYKPIDDFQREYSIKIDDNSKSVDVVVMIKSKKPTILIECKSVGKNLDSQPFNQLCLYFENSRESKLGILTDGIIYKFYTGSLKNEKKLNSDPFFEFNIRDYSNSDLEDLASFHKLNIDINNILEEAKEGYFLESFDEALFRTLYKPKKEFIKLIFDNMGGGRMSDKVSKNIFSLINSISYEQALEKIKINEAKESKEGILTTSDEIKAFHIIKTILGVSPKIKEDSLKRVGYRDYKTHFKIIIDEKQSKEICTLWISSKGNSIHIRGKKHNLKSITVKEITKHRRELISSAVSNLS
tara:strand:+ start:124 stop:1149 length:1026 start_codon:yes stop_codon:yes gene_type:complete